MPHFLYHRLQLNKAAAVTCCFCGVTNQCQVCRIKATPPSCFSSRTWRTRGARAQGGFTEIPGVALNEKKRNGFCRSHRPKARKGNLSSASDGCLLHAGCFSLWMWPGSLSCLARGMLQRDTFQFSTRWTNATHFSVGRGLPEDRGAPLGLHPPKRIQTGCPLASIRLLGKPHHKNEN